jgi:hypothetical protein
MLGRLLEERRHRTGGELGLYLLLRDFLRVCVTAFGRIAASRAVQLLKERLAGLDVSRPWPRTWPRL